MRRAPWLPRTRPGHAARMSATRALRKSRPHRDSRRSARGSSSGQSHWRRRRTGLAPRIRPSPDTLRIVAIHPLRLEVGQQREPELARLAKRAVAPRAIDRNADELRIVVLEFTPHFVVERDLVPTDRAPVGWIKHENDGASAETREPHRLIGGRAKLEIRRGATHWNETGSLCVSHDKEGSKMVAEWKGWKRV